MPDATRTRLRAGLGLFVAVFTLLALGCTDRPTTSGSERVDLDAVLAEHVAGLSPDGPYRDPQPAQRRATRAALDALLAEPTDTARADALLGDLGFRVTRGVDDADGRRFTLYLADPARETGWGGLLIDPSTPIRSVVEVPHPNFDLDTDLLGTALYRTLPGSALLIAGAHRQAAGGAADVAHNDASLFQVISERFAERGLAQLQLHGFAKRSLPDADAVVSTGAGPHIDLAVHIADRLKDADLRVCRAWRERCKGLEGRTNVQGTAAAKRAAPFVHLELGWSMRRDEDGRETVREAIVKAWGDQ